MDRIAGAPSRLCVPGRVERVRRRTALPAPDPRRTHRLRSARLCRRARLDAACRGRRRARFRRIRLRALARAARKERPGALSRPGRQPGLVLPQSRRLHRTGPAHRGGGDPRHLAGSGSAAALRRIRRSRNRRAGQLGRSRRRLTSAPELTGPERLCRYLLPNRIRDYPDCP